MFFRRILERPTLRLPNRLLVSSKHVYRHGFCFLPLNSVFENLRNSLDKTGTLTLSKWTCLNWKLSSSVFILTCPLLEGLQPTIPKSATPHSFPVLSLPPWLWSAQSLSQRTGFPYMEEGACHSIQTFRPFQIPHFKAEF